MPAGLSCADQDLESHLLFRFRRESGGLARSGLAKGSSGSGLQVTYFPRFPGIVPRP